MTPWELSALQNMLARNGSWTAQHNPLLDLKPEELRNRLGYKPGSGEPALADREKKARANLPGLFPPFPAGVGAPAKAPPQSIDWRAYNGGNYISPVKDQGNCGSCVAFGTCATIDGQMRIAFQGPLGTSNGNKLQDLSEAQLYYCSKTASDAHTCASGWSVTPALAYAQEPGLAPESCFPYTPGDQPCNLCTDWKKLVTQIKASATKTTPMDMKAWLAATGPLITCFSVYSDFFAYSSGVYKYQSGTFEGGHCVCVIGYSDILGGWLCKNSWGSYWGMGGYFWIGYGQCGIDDTMWGVDDFATLYHT